MSEQPLESVEPPPKAEKSRWRQVLIMLFGGLVLAIGGCAMFVFAPNGGSSGGPGALGASIFVIGVLLALVGGIFGLVYTVTAMFRSGKR